MNKVEQRTKKYEYAMKARTIIGTLNAECCSRGECPPRKLIENTL